jgi:flagellar basal-body rod protein FlgB
MDLTQIPLFAAMAKRLQWLSARQSVIAENVANANTPGYHSADLKPQDFGKLLGASAGKLQLATTDPRHIAAAAGVQSAESADPAAKVTSDKVVSLEEQMMKVSQNTSDFTFTTGLYQKQIALIKDAIGR